MIVHFVGAGPGDPELLTRKAEKILRACMICIYAGSLVSPQVIDLLPAAAEKYDSAKMSLPEITAIFKKAQAVNIDVVRLHSGDPSIYGAIREQMNELDILGIPYDVIPGVSSFQAAAAALCVELTAPEVSQTIILTRTAGRTPLPAKQDLEQLAKTGATLCIFLSILKIDEIAQTLQKHYGETCPAAVVYRASWPEQQIFRGTLQNIAAITEVQDIKSTAMIIVGEALLRDIPPSLLYDASFTHGFREGKNSENCAD